MSGRVEVGRLAMREEGDYWVAYYAMPDTMKGSRCLGSLHMKAAMIPDRNAAFMELMQEAVGDIIEEICGVRPTWNRPQRAPEHERAGRA